LNVTEGFPIILKADTSGSLEAIKSQLGDNVGILLASLGDVVESEVLTASSTGATIVGFNVKAPKDIQRLADEEGVKIYTYDIIYELFQDIERWIEEVAEAGRERILGKAEILARFPHSKTENIAGCRVTEGRISKSDKMRLKRGEEIVGNIRLISLKKQKQEADVAKQGEECGILFSPQFDFQVGDVLESVQ
jgi:translation initiation factor IF-2